MNPLLPKQFFVPDVEARVMGDGRLYLYGSLDISGETFYCSPEFRVFSTGALNQWTDHGVSFSTRDSHDPNCQLLFAPDCIQVGDTYYQFYCGDNWCEGVAVSENPFGPFKSSSPVEGADGDGIDPAVLLEEDGTVYYFWGQFILRGGRLRPDLRGIDPASFRSNLLTEKAHGFHEGASIRKRQGIYYLVYTDLGPAGKASRLSYATSQKPLGPFEKKGVLIDNFGCDPETWNNHGSIECFQGQWYVFYHRAYHGNRHNRRVCAEPIYFDEQGHIPEVQMTLGGPEGPVEASTRVEAFRATTLRGKLCSGVDYPRTSEEPWTEFLTGIHPGDQAIFHTINFGKAYKSMKIEWASARGRGKLQVRLDHEHGPCLAEFLLPDTGGWHIWETLEVSLSKKVSGEHTLLFCFSGQQGNLGNLLSFRFT